MTDETILQLAREMPDCDVSDKEVYFQTEAYAFTASELITFARRIQAATIERCANSARAYLGRTTTGYYHIDGVCDAIRSMKDA